MAEGGWARAMPSGSTGPIATATAPSRSTGAKARAAATSIWLWRDASPSMHYASLKNIDTKPVRGELITLALASLLADAGERVTVLGSALRPTSGRIAVRRIAETLFDEARNTNRTPPSLPPLLPLPAH